MLVKNIDVIDVDGIRLLGHLQARLVKWISVCPSICLSVILPSLRFALVTGPIVFKYHKNIVVFGKSRSMTRLALYRMGRLHQNGVTKP